MLSEYAERLRAHHCRFMLAQVGKTAHATLDHTGKLGELGEENVFASVA